MSFFLEKKNYNARDLCKFGFVSSHISGGGSFGRKSVDFICAGVTLPRQLCIRDDLRIVGPVSYLSVTLPYHCLATPLHKIETIFFSPFSEEKSLQYSVIAFWILAGR